MHTTSKTAAGPANLALQKAKIAVMEARPSEYRDLGMLYWQLEEAALNAKRGAQAQEVYASMAEALEGRDQAKLTQIIEALFGEKQTITGAFGDQTYSYTVDPQRLARQTIESLNEVGRERLNAAIVSSRIAGGKGKPVDFGIQAAKSRLQVRQAGSPDVMQEIMYGLSGQGDDMSSRMARKIGQMEGRGARLWTEVKRAKKPLMIGAGAAAALMMIAPSTSGSIRPTDSPQGGRGVTADTMGPPTGTGMAPPPPGMMHSPRVYNMGGGSRVSHANIRTRLGDFNSSSRDFMQSARQLSNGGHVNISVNDNRHILDPRRLAEKIEERL